MAAANGTYRGKIKAGNTDVSLKVKKNRVTSVTATIYGSCGLLTLQSVSYPPAGQKGNSARIKDGKFRVVFKGSPDVADSKRTIKGTFSRGKVRGTIKVEGRCSAERKYSAKL